MNLNEDSWAKKTEKTFEEQNEVGHEIEIHDRVLIAMLLDPRTKGNVSILTTSRWIKAKRILREEHVDA